jgi:hypothetical protein
MVKNDDFLIFLLPVGLMYKSFIIILINTVKSSLLLKFFMLFKGFLGFI